MTAPVWTKPAFRRPDVDRAGKLLIKTGATVEERDRALEIVNNWRAAHSYPMNIFQTTLRRKARLVDPKPTVAQRLKRLSSIESKLQRLSTRLSQMQDLGGCRAVVRSVADVYRLCEIYATSDIKHRLAGLKDYILEPKASGYRGIHLVYGYHSDRTPDFEDLLVEVQLRSRLQHAWATAVETVGTFLQQALKSSEGEEEWLRFFALAGSAFAQREGTSLVPDTPRTKTALLADLRVMTRELDVQRKLDAYGRALRSVEKNETKAKYFLLALFPAVGALTVTGFGSGEIDRANEMYLEAEKHLETNPSDGAQVVLVSAESIESLRRAYPNYFLDTRTFIEEVRAALRG